MKHGWKILFLVLLLLPMLPISFAQAAEVQTGLFTGDDQGGLYDPSAAIKIDLSGQKNGYEITMAGTYILTGTMNGRLTIRAGKKDLVQLVLNEATIMNPDGPGVYGLQADRIVLTLAEGTRNSIRDGAAYPLDEEGANAAVYAKTDLTINGSGSLEVIGQTAHGILSKDDLLVESGNLNIASVKDGLRGKDSVTILDGTIRIEAGSDGVISTGAETGKGSVTVEDGKITVVAGRDGIQAEGSISIANGIFDIKTGESVTQTQETSKAEQNAPLDYGIPPEGLEADRMPQYGMPSEGPPQAGMPRWGGWVEETEASYSGESMKGLKAVQSVSVMEGVFNLNTQDDAIHSDGDVIIKGGTYTILTGNDGVHADMNLHIMGGELMIHESFEGMEGRTVTIDGGIITITASDDGINAASGTEHDDMGMRGRMAAEKDAWVTINGGTITVTAGYDAIDSNGDININGGTVNLNTRRAGGGTMTIDPSGSYNYTGGQVTTNDGSENGGGGMPRDGQSPRPWRRP